MKYLYCIYFCSLLSFSQKIKFQVKDSLTKNNIEFVSVNFLNGFGIFSNNEGVVNLDLTEIQKIELSHISYNKKIINKRQIDSIIYLTPNIHNLKEIEISNDTKKRYFKKKIEKINDYSHVDFGTYGYQIASFLQIDTLNNYYLDEIDIPIEIDKLWMEINGQNFTPYSLVKISFHENINNYPSENSIIDSENIFIDKKSLNKKMIHYKLKRSILIPKEGIYYIITFLGKADENGNLILEMPFYKQLFLNNETIFTKYQPIKIPINLTETETHTYCRNIFFKNSNFTKIFPNISVPNDYNDEEKKIYIQNKLDSMGNYIVNVGYKYFTYD